MSYDIIETPCLGRAFKPGMLYDCRRDMLVPSLTLWNPQKLKSELNSQPQLYTNCEMILNDTISEKSSKLGVDADLKLSFLGGLVSVSGSASYLNDTKKSSHQARVSLKYSMLSRFDELTMAHLGPGDIEHPHIFEGDDATHVVTGVLYGADAVFVFDQDVGSSEEVTKVSGNLQASVKSLVGSIEGGANLDFNTGEKAEYKGIRCTFYGDFHLKQNPINLLDAMKVYSDLPSLIEQNGPVPKKVWLYPLTKLDSKAAKLVRQISLSLVTQTEKIMESLNEADMLTNDLIKSCHPMLDGLKFQAETFKRLVTEFKTTFQKQLVPILPKIRGGGIEEATLAEVLENVNRSPFSPALLQMWHKRKHVEVSTFNFITAQIKQSLENTNVLIATQQAEVEEMLLSFEHDIVLALVFEAGTHSDPFLEQLENSLRHTPNLTTLSSTLTAVTAPLRNNAANNRNAAVRKMSKDFIDFVRDNTGSKKVKFIVYAEGECGDGVAYPRMVLHDLQNGEVIPFTPPSVPGMPQCKWEKTTPSANLEW
ncbi:stonustoxin subunit alpha-like isoform X2 [Paramacrobiotus metropolitanus]|nr:stonustoxin subunit alpha-like isoform X2 [Paramacrobiotus metropolitanus]